MTEAKLNESEMMLKLAEITADAAIEQMAKINNTDKETVLQAVSLNVPNAMKQLEELKKAAFIMFTQAGLL